MQLLEVEVSKIDYPFDYPIKFSSPVLEPSNYLLYS